MNLKQFVLGLFSGLHLNGELESVRTAARADARQAVGTYLDEFESEANRMFAERRQRLIGVENPKIVDAKPTNRLIKKPARR